MSVDAVAVEPELPVAQALERLGREGRPGVCDTGRYRLRYALWGNGPPIVFVHGISDMARSFALLAAGLCKHFTCILYELPTGESDGAGLGGYRHRHFADDLIALLDHLQLERTYAFGSSFGATIVLRTLAEHPRRFARAIVQGGFARRPVSRVEVVLCDFARYWRGRMREMPIRTSLKNPKERSVFETVTAERAEFMTQNCGAAPIAAVARIALIISKLDLRPLLPRVPHPVRLIGGDRDGIVKPQYEQELLAGLPNAERVEITHCGHVPQYTHPGVLATLTRQFFTPECSVEKKSACADHAH